MPSTDFKKTSLMRQIERRHPGKDITQIVADTLRTSDSIEAAADALGVSEATLSRYWMPAMGIEVRTERQVVTTAAAG